MFGVTASGVRLDHFHPTDNEDDVDNQFDPVWEAKVFWTKAAGRRRCGFRFRSCGSTTRPNACGD